MNWRLAIDFGTSNTAAAIDANGSVRPVALSDGGLTMPSAVVLTPNGFRVGDEAMNAQLRHPEGFERTPKTLIGRGDVVLGDKIVSPEDLITEVYSFVRAAALRQQNHQPPREVWLTHPVAWAPSQIESLRKSAVAAGFAAESIRTVSEPVAAAAHYARNQNAAPGSRVAVVDFGGGTLDLAVLERSLESPVGYRVLAYGGDPVLGGRTFDARLLDWTLDTLRSRGHEELAERLHKPSSMAELRAQSELSRAVTAAKAELSTRPDADIAVSLGEEDAVVTITRTEYERLIDGDIDRAAKLLQEVFSRVSGERPSLVYLTGGSSRTPAISRMIREHTKLQIATLDDPKLVTAEGALYVTAAARGGRAAAARPQGRPPQQSRPPQSGPAQGHPAQSGPVQSRPPQGAPAQQRPPQNAPTQGVPTQGVPTQGVPPQGRPPQAVAPQGNVPSAPRPQHATGQVPRQQAPATQPRPNVQQPIAPGAPRSAAPQPFAAMAAAPSPAQTAAKKRNTPLIVALSVLAVALVGGLIWGGIQLFGGGSGETGVAAPKGDINCWDGSTAASGENCTALTGEAAVQWIASPADATCTPVSLDAKTAVHCTWLDKPEWALYLFEFDSAATAVDYGNSSYGGAGSEWQLAGESAGTKWEGEFSENKGGYSAYYVYDGLPYAIFMRLDNDASGQHDDLGDMQGRVAARTYEDVATAVAAADRA